MRCAPGQGLIFGPQLIRYEPHHVQIGAHVDRVTVPLADLRAALVELGLEPGSTRHETVGRFYSAFPLVVRCRIEKHRSMFIAVVPECGFCGGTHRHGAEDPYAVSTMERIPHCGRGNYPPNARYRLVPDPETLPDPGQLLAEQP